MIMSDDPIVAEVREIREQQAKRFNFDVEAIARDVHERETHTTDRQLVRLTPKKPAVPPTR
jgi:hypothetical protein